MEFPENWPNLFDLLLQLCNTEMHTKMKALIVTNKVILQLVSIQTKEGKERFKMIGQKLFSYYFNSWKEIVNSNFQFLSSFFNQNHSNNSDPKDLENFFVSSLSGVYLLKILREIILYAYIDHHQHPMIKEFFRLLLTFLFKFVNICKKNYLFFNFF
jgi:hypothetical protein